MNRVAVNEQVLRWAIGRSGVTETTLQAKFPITAWLAGQREPTIRQLEALATATRTPLGYFFLQEPPDEPLPIPYFRTFGDEVLHEPSPDLLDTVHMMQMRQEWVREYIIEQGHDPLQYVQSVDLKFDPVDVAAKMRQVLGLGFGWADSFRTWEDALRYLRQAMEEAGVFVVINGVMGNNTHRRLDPTEFRGFVLVDRYAPFVFVNRADAVSAQMFTLAHELAHVFYGQSAAFDLRALHPATDPVENACNQAAAEFLVPARQLRELWPAVQHESNRYQTLAGIFKVSQIVIGRRLLDLSYITKEEFFSFYSEQIKTERTKQAADDGGGDFYNLQNNRVGRRFFQHVANALAEGTITYTEAYRLTGMSGQTFRTYADQIRGDRSR